MLTISQVLWEQATSNNFAGIQSIFWKNSAPSSKEAKKDAKAMDDDNKGIARRHHQKVVLLLDSICLEMLKLEV